MSAKKVGAVWGLCATLLSVTAQAAEPVLVSVQPLGELAVYPEVRASATVLSLNDSRISAELAARIVEVAVRVGDVVELGAVLARLDAQDFQLAVQGAQAALHVTDARLDLARYQLERARSLSQQQAVSEELLKQRETEVATLAAQRDGQQAALRAAERNIDKTTLTAPFKAIVMERAGQVGEMASPGAALVRILAADQLEVSAKLPSAQVPLLYAGRAVLDIDGQRYPLKLRAVTPALDTRERVQEARLEFTGAKALPGAAGQLLLRETRPHLAADVLVRRGDALGVFVLENAHAKFIAIPQAEAGRPAPLALPVQTPIIVKGRFRLQDGDVVTVQ